MQSYREAGAVPQETLDSEIMSTADTPVELLLNMHVTFAKAIRNWWQTKRLHRIRRYTKGRLDVLISDYADDVVAGEDDNGSRQEETDATDEDML